MYYCWIHFQYLEELKDELTKLKQYEKDEDMAFLKFIYVTWPPKRKDFKMVETPKFNFVSYDDRKKALQVTVTKLIIKLNNQKFLYKF